MSIQFSQEDALRIAWNQALDAVKALARGDAEVLRDDDGEPIGVRWPTEDGDCVESLHWVSEG